VSLDIMYKNSPMKQEAQLLYLWVVHTTFTRKKFELRERGQKKFRAVTHAIMTRKNIRLC
ncbi:MAG: hypothetical protein IJG36_11485, partial [Synergistaceae bacterium]|nr:hypothetical protein [Synergistaceae bacterium]